MHGTPNAVVNPVTGQPFRGRQVSPPAYTGIDRGSVLLAASDVVFLCAVGTGLYVTCSGLINGAKKGKSPLNLFSGG